MINLYRKFSKILLIKYHWLKLLWRTLNERRNAGIIIGIITQRCLKQIKTDNHKRNGRKHIGEITVLPIMSLTPYYTEVISLSVSSVQPDLKKGKTTRVEGDGTRENHYWPQSREVRTVSKFTLEFTLVFKTTLLSTTRFSCGTANWPNWKQRENVEI